MEAHTPKLYPFHRSVPSTRRPTHTQVRELTEVLRRCKHNGFPVLRDGGHPGPPPDHPTHHAYAHLHPAAPPGHHVPGGAATTTPGPLPTSTLPHSLAISVAGAPAGPLDTRTPFAAGAAVAGAGVAGAVGLAGVGGPGAGGPGGASGGGFYPGSGGVAPGAPGSCCGLVTRGHLMALLQKVVLAGACLLQSHAV